MAGSGLQIIGSFQQRSCVLPHQLNTYLRGIFDKIGVLPETGREVSFHFALIDKSENYFRVFRILAEKIGLTCLSQTQFNDGQTLGKKPHLLPNLPGLV